MLVVCHTLHYLNLLTVLTYVGFWSLGPGLKSYSYAFPVITDDELLV
jgi:hypothetical protein